MIRICRTVTEMPYAEVKQTIFGNAMNHVGMGKELKIWIIISINIVFKNAKGLFQED